jgi:hypothetical protein
MLCTKVGVLHPFLAMHCPLLPMLHPFLAMARPFQAMLHAFAATRREGEDASHEESRSHHALHGVPDPSRESGSACLGCSSERETTRSAYVGYDDEELNAECVPSAHPSARLSTLASVADVTDRSAVRQDYLDPSGRSEGWPCTPSKSRRRRARSRRSILRPTCRSGCLSTSRSTFRSLVFQSTSHSMFRSTSSFR